MGIDLNKRIKNIQENDSASESEIKDIFLMIQKELSQVLSHKKAIEIIRLTEEEIVEKLQRLLEKEKILETNDFLILRTKEKRLRRYFFQGLKKEAIFIFPKNGDIKGRTLQIEHHQESDFWTYSEE